MKHSLFFFLILVAANVFAGGATKIELSPSDTINTAAQLPGGASAIVVSQFLKNVSGSDIIVKWNIAGYNGENGWDYKACSPDSCFGFPPPPEMPEVFIPAGDSFKLDWEVYAYTQIGTGYCTCNFWVVGDSSQNNVQNFLRIDVDMPSSISELSAQAIKTYPNPVNTLLNIEATEPIDEILLVNNMGQKVLQTAFVSSIDFSTIPKGFYSMVFKRRSEVVSIKHLIH